MKSAVVFAVCLVQALASPINYEPFQTGGDLNLPGFTLLNMALNDGTVDLAPGLARMPSHANSDLAGTIATFFSEMSYSCKFYGRNEMSESFEALVDTAPDIEKLVVLNNIVNETWNFIIALRGEGLAVINLRSFVADTIEVMESTGKDLITDMTEQVKDLKSGKQELIEFKVLFKELVETIDIQFAVQVADVAEVLRILANHVSDTANNRNLVATDMMSLFKAFNMQRRDLYNAVIDISGKWKIIEEGLIRIVGSEAVAPINENINKLVKLTQKEMTDLGGSLLHTVNAARKSYEAMLEIFPFARRIEK